VWTQRQEKALAQHLHAAGHQVLVRHAMRYGNPSLPQVLDGLRAEGATRILVLPLYPQYAAATTASIGDKIGQWTATARRVPELRFVGEYHDDPAYINALAHRLRSHWKTQGRGERLVLSFHGVPERSLMLGDPYHCQCYKTARLLGQALGLQPADVLVTFQSRFGKAKWLQPYTEPTLCKLAAEGVKSVDVMCPGFVADCLETLEEIAQEARDAYLAAGGQVFNYVTCLNDEPLWIDALSALAVKHLQGWNTQAQPAPAAGTQSEAELQQQLARALGAQR
jgi:ferrochelatase